MGSPSRPLGLVYLIIDQHLKLKQFLGLQAETGPQKTTLLLSMQIASTSAKVNFDILKFVLQIKEY